MTRRLLFTLLVGCIAAGSALAQTSAPRFSWKTDQVLTYRVEQLTSAAEVVGENTTETKTKLSLTKRWQVKEVDKAGVAMLQLSLSALRYEITRPGGGVLLYDSANPEKSDPDMAKKMSGYIDRPVAVLRIDPQGKVVEVKESKFGPTSRFESELPFVLTLPDAVFKEAQTWERSFAITLAPPQGAGERYKASQKYRCKSVSAETATIAVTTAIQDLPDDPLDQVPLLQLQPEGEVVFDLKKGCMRSARLTIEKALKDHQGDGSIYRFRSVYTEEYLADK